jgi:hypothetical protein
MAKIKIHAGDFLKGEGQFFLGAFSLKTTEHPFLGEGIAGNQLELVEIASEESIKKLGGTIGWGLAGGILLGPVGLLAGLLLGGRKKEVAFIAKFKDGRKLLASTDSKTYMKIQAACF